MTVKYRVRVIGIEGSFEGDRKVIVEARPEGDEDVPHFAFTRWQIPDGEEVPQLFEEFEVAITKITNVES